MARVPFGLTELSCQESLNKVPGQRRSYRAAAHANNIHVIIFYPLTSREMVFDQGGLRTWNLVRTNRRPHTATTDRYSTINLPFHHTLREGDNEIRIIVARIESMCAKVNHLMTCFSETHQQIFL